MISRARETEKSLWDWIESGEPPEDPQQREALRRDTDFLANLGRAYRHAGRTALAEACLSLQLHLFPNELSGYNGLAGLAFQRGRHEKALRLWAQSLRLYGDQPEVVKRVKQLADKSDELSGKAEWVISEYAHRRARRPGPGQDPWEPPAGPKTGHRLPFFRLPFPFCPFPSPPVLGNPQHAAHFVVGAVPGVGFAGLGD